MNRACLLLVLATAGCQAPDRATEVVPSSNRLVDPAPDSDGVVRVLVMHDMEGLSGQDDPRTFSFLHDDLYERGQEYLIGDVNAVIAGLYDGGADEVHVMDTHGSGNREPDLLVDELDPRARFDYRDVPPWIPHYIDPSGYDAVAMVGMHAKTGSGGFASHTYGFGIEIRINGATVTEPELYAFSLGTAGVPVIFVSGDDRLAEDLATMPWIEYVMVKTATSASTADLRPVPEVRAELRAAARRALERRDQARAMQIGLPVRAAVHAVPPASLAVLEGVPGIEYEDETVSFTAASFEEANVTIGAVIGVAQMGYYRLFRDMFQGVPGRDALWLEYRDRYRRRWLDYESGRWPPSEADREER